MQTIKAVFSVLNVRVVAIIFLVAVIAIENILHSVRASRRTWLEQCRC